jgi:pimeloyl-ACP methyl ester carboxylesterase
MKATRPAMALGKSGIPTLVLSGEKDLYVTQAVTNDLVSMVKATLWKRYPNTGHAIHWERPEEFARDVQSFLSH